MRASSQVAASAVGEGTLADGSRSSQSSPRTPAGPSDITIRRSPTAGSACSAQKSAPVSSRTFCSSVSAASRSCSRLSWSPAVAIAAQITRARRASRGCP